MITLADIQKSQPVMDDLASQFDFDLGRAARDNAWIKLVPQKAFVVVAGESGGGVFLACGDGEIERGPILYANCQGQAGYIASHFTELVSIMMALPYWRDLLKFSGGGNLKEMRRSAQFSEQDCADDYPGLPAARKRILDTFPVPVLPDPVGSLHACVHASDCTLVADDGWRYTSLFNHFKSSDNPGWT